jgi:hypothetical protein
MGGMIDPPPVRSDAIQRPNLKVMAIFVAIIVGALVICYVAAWVWFSLF